MAVTSFQDLPLAERDREWDGDAAEKRVRAWAGAEDEPNEKYRDAHVWYDAEKKQNFTAYKLLIADVVDGRLVAVPRGRSETSRLVWSDAQVVAREGLTALGVVGHVGDRAHLRVERAAQLFHHPGQQAHLRPL